MEALAEPTTIKMQRYASYKDSGVEWLREVPEHWRCIRMKFLYQDVSEKNKPGAELLSVTQSQGVVPRAWVESRMVMPNGGLDSFKFIRKGDFAISLRSFEGGLEYCHHDGIVSPAYTVLKAKIQLDSAYYKYLFKSNSFISELQTSIVGIREGKNISYAELCYSLLPVPTPDEQTRIAQFLDQKTTQIDQAIARKEKLIELLKERRQILIHNAVTRGVDPNVKMKDSGVEWMGEIPEHWEVVKFKYIVRTKARLGWKGLTASEYVEASEYRFLATPDIKGENIDFRGAYFITQQRYDESPEIMLKTDDILLVKDGSTLGIVNRVKELPFACTVNSSIAVLRILKNERMTAMYLQYFLKSDYCQKVIEFKKDGMGVPHLFQSDINNFIAIVPPIPQQNEIAHSIELSEQKLNSAMTAKRIEIEKLKEYKATLINAAVTGKIKIA